MGNTSKNTYIFLVILLACILILGLLLIIVMPFFIVFELIIGLFEFILIRKIKDISKNEKKVKGFENKILNQGYSKICDNFYINNNEVILNQKKYKFSQIIDCELINDVDKNDFNYGHTKGRIKDDGKIKSKSLSTSTEIEYCRTLYINVTVNDFANPIEVIDCRGNDTLNIKSRKYNERLQIANKALSTLKLIISNNNKNTLEICKTKNIK